MIPSKGPTQARNEDWFGYLGSKWNVVAQTAAIIGTVISGFLFAPPTGAEGGPGDISKLGLFVIAVLLGLAFIPAQRWDHKESATVWWSFGIVLLLLALTGYFLYQAEFGKRTVQYDQGIIVTGRDRDTLAIRPEMRSRVEALNLPREKLVFRAGGRVADIWSPGALAYSRQLLDVMYLACAAAFALCLISVIQAIYCVSRTNQRASNSIVPSSAPEGEREPPG